MNVTKKIITIGIITLFIVICIHPAFAENISQSIRINQNEKDDNPIINNNYLERKHLPLLILSLIRYKLFRYRDVKIENVMGEIINQIRLNGKLNDSDVQNILIDSDMTSYDVHIFCKIIGCAYSGVGSALPGQIFFYLTSTFIGVGGILGWGTSYAIYGETEINIRVGLNRYTNPHFGNAFGFFGIGLTYFGYPDCGFLLNGYALIAFVEIK